MARFVGKTFESLNTMLNNTGLFLNHQDKSSKLLPWTLDSKSLIRKLKNADSKQAEEDIIHIYLSAIEKRLSEPDVPNADVNDMIKMCMTCETIGYPATFIYVHCLKLAQTGNLQEKHTGYTAAAFFLNPHQELVILLINTIQKDLQSSNHIEVLLALTSVCNLINVDNVNNVLHLVEEKLNHEKASVRKSAILTLNHCLNLSNSQSAYQMSIPKLERALTDHDLEVVSASVATLLKIVQKLPCDFTYLIKSLVQLQDQILLRRVPRSLVYCDIPAPWLQLDILKLLKVLCTQAEQFQQVIPILKKTLQQVGLQNTVAYAVMFQVIETLTYVEPCSELVEMMLTSVSIFLKSKNINLKLTGIEALVLVVKQLRPSITAAQQDVIMECLKLPDETLQLKTLELLFHLSNPSNVQAICKKLMEFLTTTTNPDKRKELALRVIKLAMKFSDRQDWFVSICVSILIEAGDFLPSIDVYDIINTIAKDNALKVIAKKSCTEICKRGQYLSPSFLKLTASVLSSSSEFEEFLPFLLSVADEESTTWLLVSLTEVLLTVKEVTPNLAAFLKNVEIKYEYSSQILKQLLRIMENISDIKEFDTNQEMDPSLTFLDNVVVEALENNSLCYLPPSFRLETLPISASVDDLKTKSSTTSEISFAQDSVPSPSPKSPTYSEFSSISTSFQSLSADKDLHSPSISKSKCVWTDEGRKPTKQDTAADDSITTQEEKSDDLQDLFAGIS